MAKNRMKKTQLIWHKFRLNGLTKNNIFVIRVVVAPYINYCFVQNHSFRIIYQLSCILFLNKKKKKKTCVRYLSGTFNKLKRCRNRQKFTFNSKFICLFEILTWMLLLKYLSVTFKSFPELESKSNKFESLLFISKYLDTQEILKNNF